MQTDAGCSHAHRLGGRVHTHHIEGSPHHVEFGATWVGPSQANVLGLMKELNLNTIPTYCTGNNIQNVKGYMGTYSGTIPPLGLLALLDMHFAIRKVDTISETVNAQNAFVAHLR